MNLSKYTDTSQRALFFSEINKILSIIYKVNQWSISKESRIEAPIKEITNFQINRGIVKFMKN